MVQQTKHYVEYIYDMKRLFLIYYIVLNYNIFFRPLHLCNQLTHKICDFTLLKDIFILSN